MPVPIQTQLFDAFLGEQQGIHSIILPDIFSSGGSKNLTIDKFGRAKKIAGYVKQNPTPVTTDTDGDETLCRALFLHRTSTGGAFSRRLLGVFDDGDDEYEVWYSDNDGATWTLFEDFGAGSVGTIPDIAQLGNVAILVNGVEAPRQSTPSGWSTVGYTQLAAPTATEGSSGNLVGSYAYKLLPALTGGGVKVGSIPSTPLQVTDKLITLAWTADADTNVAGYYIYRTTGSGAVYYNVDYVDGRTTVAYTDNTPDLNILENRVLSEHGDPPPTVSRVESHKQRMWYGNESAHPQRAYWSDPGDPASVYANNYIEFADAETLGDVIVGMVGDFEGHLAVFEERSIWTISGTGQIIGNTFDWSRIRTNAQTGAVSGRAVARIPAGSKFVDQNGQIQTTNTVTLAYFTPLGDIRLFDGDNDIIISHPKKNTLAAFNFPQRRKIFAVTDTPRGEVTWVFPTGANDEPNTAVTWNFRWGVWYTREWAFACGVEVETSNDASVLLAGSNSLSKGGYVYRLWEGNDFDGEPIEAKWMTKTLYGVNEQALPALSQTKRWRWADFLFETDQSVTLTVEWLQGNSPDEASGLSSISISPAASTVVTVEGSPIVTSDGSEIVVSESSAQVQALLVTTAGDYLHDEGIRLRVGDNASNGSWSLESFVLAYQLLPGLKRRMVR